MLTEMALSNQGAEMLFERIAIPVGQANRVTHGDTPLFPGKLDDLQREFGKRCQYQLLTLNLAMETADLFSERAQEKH